MLIFIGCNLHLIKQVHSEFMAGLNVIMTCDFCQAPTGSS
jgi:hypothetical protein